MRDAEEIAEGKKYDHLYSNKYPAGGVGWPLKWLNRSNHKLKVLDVGCGHGLLSNVYLDYTGIDVSEYIIEENRRKKRGRYFVCGALEAYDMFKDETFDLVLSLDVLEHFPRSNLEKYIKSLSQIHAKEFLFAICCRESGYKDAAGHGLHLSVMSKEEWLTLLSRYFVIVDSSDLNAKKTFCVLLRNLNDTSV